MDIKKYFVDLETPVKDAIKAIDSLGKKTVFIVDKDEKLKGIFTDGDMRRFILSNGNLNSPVKEAMNPNPKVFHEHDDIKTEKLKNNKMMVFPIVNDLGQVIRATFWDNDELISSSDTIKDKVPVVIMAGGKGTRLYPYTKILPKPLIPIGDIPIIQHIINRFNKYNCNQFRLIVNHKSNMIKSYFGEIEKNYELIYEDEKEFLGTGGGLSLLKGKINSTFFLSNCDILIDANYGNIYKYHKQKKNKITVVCALKNITIPYGVMNLDDNGNIKSMKEKPEISFLTNTGLYLIEPEVIDDLEPNTFIHMPEIVQKYMDKNENVGVYPLSENQWLDMGQIEEMENMIKVLEEQ
ncbi:nucleotidyltransferase family protein [Clostridium sp. CTA-7]